ncbi:MAG TPA: ArgE/DapE family deacylase [Gaiellaceae bacterium]|nr:ArgE/DapE family deacylase [Gaiellaceae bacterium]
MAQSLIQKELDRVDEAVDDLAESAFAFLERLVAEASVLGDEEPAQAIVAAELDRLGFAVERVPFPADIADQPGSGVPRLPVDGRSVVVGRRPGNGRSLLINGHIDVVPPGDASRWSTDPFAPHRHDGWLVGRGAGDMKAGFAMATLALEAVQQAVSETALGPLTFVSAVEEECTGNGTLAASLAGALADAAVHPEPTGLELLLSGIGLVWFELVVDGRPTHAHVADEGVNGIEAALPLLAALRELERSLRERSGEPCVLNIGTFHAGDWQSSVPAVARIGIRLGLPSGTSPAEGERLVRDAVGAAAAADPWLADHPPQVVPNGFRAEAYSLDAAHPLVEAFADAHHDVFGAAPAIAPGTATTDARYYVNRFAVPALCYGPRVRNIHGLDEAVELASIVAGARVLSRFLLRWPSLEAGLP